MPANLGVSFNRCRAFQEIHSLHNRVHAIPSANFQHGPLESPFPLHRLKISEQVKLIAAIVIINVIGRDPQAADGCWYKRGAL